MPRWHEAALLRHHQEVSVKSMMMYPHIDPTGHSQHQQQNKDVQSEPVRQQPSVTHESPLRHHTHPQRTNVDDAALHEARILSIMTKTGYSREKVEELFRLALTSSEGEKLSVTASEGSQSQRLHQEQQQLFLGNRNSNGTNRSNKNSDYNACYYRGGCTCDDLFGKGQLIQALDGTCLMHQVVHWTSCRLGRIAVDPSRIIGSLGGETNFTAIWGRSELMESLEYQAGALALLQPQLAPIVHSIALANFSFDGKVIEFLQSAMATSRARKHSPQREVSEDMGADGKSSTTLLVRRGAYANPCMALLTMYNVYLTLEHFQVLEKDPRTIVWLDGHARGDLDDVWETLFGEQPIHIKQLKVTTDRENAMDRSDSTVQLDNAIIVNTKSHAGNEGMDIYRWRRTNSNTPNCTIGPTNTLVEFRDFVLHQFGMERRRQDSTNVALEGSARPRLTFLVRKDYVAHPRSTGQTDRALANPYDDSAYLGEVYVNHTISVVSFEGMSFRKQLEHVTQTDIFVAVHGAGNIHVLFLPDHATFVEYFPSSFRRRRRFRFLAECLNITYHQKRAWVVKEIEDKSKVLVRLRPKTPTDLTSWCDNDQKVYPC